MVIFAFRDWWWSSLVGTVFEWLRVSGSVSAWSWGWIGIWRSWDIMGMIRHDLGGCSMSKIVGVCHPAKNPRCGDFGLTWQAHMASGQPRRWRGDVCIPGRESPRESHFFCSFWNLQTYLSYSGTVIFRNLPLHQNLTLKVLYCKNQPILISWLLHIDHIVSKFGVIEIPWSQRSSAEKAGWWVALQNSGRALAQPRR